MAIKGIKEIALGNNNNYLIEPTLYTTVNQTSAATAFTADLDKFELFNGVTVAVKFGANVTNNASATLNINETGAKAIYYEGAAITASKLKAKRTYIFTYNGTQWELVGDLDTNIQSDYGNITTSGKIGTGNNLVVTSSGTVQAGATISSAISTQTTSTKFLREDGAWAAPSYIANRTYTAISGKKPTGNQTPEFGSTFDIEQVGQDTTGQVSVTERTVKIPDTAASASTAGLVTTGTQTLGGGKTLRFTSRIYPLIGTSAERSQWYKITFPYSTITTGSSAQWFMNSFDLHFGGGYNSNPSGVAHVTFYWTRAANNGAWTVGQQAAFIEGTLANKIGLYYRIAEPGVLYVNNTANVYNGIWIDNLYVDDTAINLNWSTITIETTAAITESTSPKLSDYTKITTSYLYNDGGTLKTEGNFEGKYIKGTWLYTSAATAKTSTTKLATIESDNFIYYISPANALKSAIGTTAIGGTTTPIYWNGSAFSTGTALGTASTHAHEDYALAGHNHDGVYAPIVSGGYLPKSGGQMTGTARITWADSGSWGSSDATFPNKRGGLYWSGTSDWIDLFAEETASDKLNLVINFGDDTNPSLVLRDRGTDAITLTAGSGTITATNFNGLASKATAANLTTTANAIAYYTNTTGVFGTKASANGVLYATSANGALNWGTLPIAQGGTGGTTAQAAISNLFNNENISTVSANLTDETILMSSNVNGQGSDSTWYRRKASAIWGYVKSKADNIYATQTTVNGLIAAADALVYKGVRAGAAITDNNAYGALTPSANCGDTYKVSTVGFINGLRVEVGDMLICTTDNTEEATSSNYTTIRNNWNIIQTSEGSVSTSSTSSTDNAIVRWDGASGRIIQDSGVTIDDDGRIFWTHTSGKSTSGMHFKYSNTIDYWWGVGSGDSNHGLYDQKKGSSGTWIIYADTNNNWSFTGNAATATSATSATTANALKNINPNTGSGNRPTDVNTAITHVNNGGVQHIKIADSTNSITGHLLHFHWDTGDSWDGQLLLPNNSSNSSMKWRSCSAANTWDSWRTLLDSSNYSSYALPVSGGTLGKSNTIDNTAFKNILILYSNQSNESSTTSFDATKSSWGIGFQRKWNNGTEGAATHAGIYAYGISEWRTGLVFRTKTGSSSSAIHDVSALILNHNADAAFSGNISLSDATKSIVRDGSSINWNQANTRAMIRMITKAGWSPLFSLKANTGWWNMGHYNSSGFNNHLLFTFLNDNDVSGVSGAQNHMDYTVRLIPVVHTDNGTTDRAFVTAPWANSSAAVGNATQPVYIDDNGVATACATTTVSNAWSVASNDTTKKIPMISTTVNGVTGTAVAIPEASTSAGGIVTIGAQNFGGSKTFTGDTFEIRADIIRLRNEANSNNAATNQPYVTSLIIGDGRYINFTEYKDDHLVINSKSILLDTTSNGISAYDSTKTYSLNTIVWHDRSYYYCSTAITEAEAWNSAHWTAMPASNIMANASFVPWKNNSYTLGTSSYRWSKVYIGTENSYGNDTTPIYWNNGVPKACTSYANASVNYATSAGSANGATTATYSTYPKIVASNEIRFDVNTKPSSATDLHIGYAWSDGSKDAKINGYRFDNGNGSNLAKVYASEFVGSLNGNASTATTSTWTTLLKPINTATTASASTWSIPSGSYQVWGERFSDTRLKYTPEGGTEKTVTDTGDWIMWLSGDGTTNQAKLNMRIDGTYYGTFSGNASSASGIPQTGTSTASWRKILLTGGDVYNAWNTSVTSRTASAYQAAGVSVQPSTGAMHISGQFTTSSTTASTSSTTGALVVGGGIATGAASYLTGSVHIIGSAGSNALMVRGISGCDANGNRGESVTADGQGLFLNINGGPVLFGYGDSTAENYVCVQYNQDATSTSTGAFRVNGGLSVVKKIYAGNSIIAGGSAPGVEINIKAISNAGQIYLYSAATDAGNRGIWLHNHGGTNSRALFTVDQNNTITSMAPLVGNYILDVRGYSYWGSTSRYIKDEILLNNARQRVGETWYDVGDATNVTMGRFYWREYSPNSTATTGTTGKYEDYYLPAVNVGRTDSSSYAIITTKNLSDITSVGTLTSDLTLDTTHAVHGILGTFNTTTSTDCGGLSWHEVSAVGPSTTLNVNDAPNTDWWYVLRNRHTNTTNNYYTDIAFPFNSNGIYYKIIRNNTIVNTGAYNGWVKVLDEFGGIFNTTSALEKYGNNTSWVNARDGAIIRRYRNLQGETTASLVNSGNYDIANGRYVAAVSLIGLYYTWSIAQYTNDTLYFDCTNNDHYNSATNQTVASISMSTSGVLTANQVYGAVWNDYAEYRKQLYKIEPGRVVYDLDDGYILPTNKRLQPGAQVVSDTFGFAIGETEESKTPLAVTGRVLVYTYRDRYEYHAGDAVCSAPNGTVDIMTREEIKEYPDAIIGIVSEIPHYKTWGSSNVPINGRIWIKVR